MKIAFTGCWHSEFLAAKTAIDYCHEEGITTLVQTGDFLYDRDYGERLTHKIEKYLDQNNIDLRIIGIRGNHDNPAYYRSLPVLPETAPLARVSDHVSFAPDGTILTFDGVTIAFLGGAHSVDHPARVEGKSWWADERPSPEAIQALMSQKFDVFVSHEAPALIDYPLLPPPRDWWDIEGSNLIRAQLAELIDTAKPSLTITGHMHIFQAATFEYSDGSTFYSVTLDHGHYFRRIKTANSNLADFLWVLDTENMAFTRE